MFELVTESGRNRNSIFNIIPLDYDVNQWDSKKMCDDWKRYTRNVMRREGRRVVNIDPEQVEEIEALPDANLQKFAGMVRRLLYEALQHRKNSTLEPVEVISCLDTWGKPKVVALLLEMINWLANKTEGEDSGEIAIKFVKSLINKDEPCNGEISILAAELGIEAAELTRIRNSIWKDENAHSGVIE